MTWFKVDDKSTFNARVVAAGNQAWGALVRAGAWCSERETDGAISADVAGVIEPSRKIWQKLCDVGLLHPIDGGWQITNFLDWNPSAEQARSIRAARAEAGSKGGKRSSGTRAEAKQADKQLLEQKETNGESKVNPDPDPDPDPDPRDPPVVPQGDQRPPPKTRPKPGDDPRVLEVLEHWAAQKYHPGTVQPDTQARRSRVAARLAEGFSPEQLKAAIDGAWRDDWLMGRDPKSNGKAYRGIETILRDAGQVEKLSALADPLAGIDQPYGDEFSRKREEAAERAQKSLLPPWDLERASAQKASTL